MTTPLQLFDVIPMDLPCTSVNLIVFFFTLAHDCSGVLGVPKMHNFSWNDHPKGVLKDALEKQKIRALVFSR